MTSPCVGRCTQSIRCLCTSRACAPPRASRVASRHPLLLVSPDVSLFRRYDVPISSPCLPNQPAALLCPPCPAQYLNFKLNDVSVVDEARFPHMLSVKSCFIRGSVVRYVQLPPGRNPALHPCPPPLCIHSHPCLCKTRRLASGKVLLAGAA